MDLDDALRESLATALCEADLLGFEVDPEARIAAATFRVFTLPESGPVPEDRRVQFRFGPVGRVAASLREGRRDDPAARVVPFGIEELLEVVQSFGGLRIYASEYFDIHEKSLSSWGERLSLDWRSGADGLAHSITLFQAGIDRTLDVCVWFDRFRIFDPGYRPIEVDDFVAGGRRWWQAFSAGDPRTLGYGMVPLKG